MALVAHSELPAFEALRREGRAVMTPDQLASSGLPQLSIGLLNLMPDAALTATDRQFARLVSSYADSADLWVYPFTAAVSHRSDVAREHMNNHYLTFDEVRQRGLDALIVTGANPACQDLADEVFWKEMVEVFDWAGENVRSVLCSCLATHGVLKEYNATERTLLPRKRWGVYSHEILVEDHPLVHGLKEPVDAPHSHNYDVSKQEFEAAGAKVLAESDEAGVHMAVSDDNFYVFFQGHPEYEAVSLLKEYKREVGRYFQAERDDFPPYPENYFDSESLALLARYREELISAKDAAEEPPPFPETSVVPQVKNTWTPAGETIYHNWLEQVAFGNRG